MIIRAVEVLRAGGLVAIPTETVYGLAADASNPDAIAKIFLAKQRPSDHPVIVHVADVAQLSDWAVDISKQALLLAKHYWPGPLTLILKKAPHVNELITGGQDTIGLRIPNHPLTLALLKEFGGGVAAPSANRFGRISPTTAEAVREELGDQVDFILEGGQCEVGVESTILDMSGEMPVILRPGMISVKQIEAVLQQPVSLQKKNAPRVSGSHETHYAPQTETRLLSLDELKKRVMSENEVGIVAFSDMDAGKNFFKKMANDPKQYAHDLYHVLRELDHKNLKKIFIEKVPDRVEWDAIRDRLQRAAIISF